MRKYHNSSSNAYNLEKNRDTLEDVLRSVNNNKKKK
jgi:hypothetical protein